MRTKRIVVVMMVALLVVGSAGTTAFAASSRNAGSPIVESAIWADGQLMGTIFLGDLRFNNNPQSFDQLFMVPGQAPVAEAAPGRGYNGGRWIPVEVTWNVQPYLLTSYGEVRAAADAGDVDLGDPQHEAAFLCPLIPGR